MCLAVVCERVFAQDVDVRLWPVLLAPFRLTFPETIQSYTKDKLTFLLCLYLSLDIHLCTSIAPAIILVLGLLAVLSSSSLLSSEMCLYARRFDCFVSMFIVR